MAAVGDRDPAIVGIKGAGLANASRAGLPVPAGFTLSTAACRAFQANDNRLPTEIDATLASAVRSIEAATNRHFGTSARKRSTDLQKALTLSVRSSPSAMKTMPGLMSAVRDLGLPPAYPDTLRVARAEASYLQHAIGLDEGDLEDALESDDPLGALGELRRGSNQAVDPADAMGRLRSAIRAALLAWTSDRAVSFRQAHGLSEQSGTAIIVQAMASSVVPEIAMVGGARTRNADDGVARLRGFVVPGAQSAQMAEAGDVQRLSVVERPDDPAATLERTDPELLAKIEAVGRVLERTERHPIDMRFVIGGGKRPAVWVLHATRTPLSTRASIRAAVDMAKEGIITEREAVLRVEPTALDRVLHPRVAANVHRNVLARGLTASPGAASGTIVFTSAEAMEARNAERRSILVCTETGPDDILGIQASDGVVTTRGGLTSHAAVVARGLGRPCVTSAGALRVDAKERTVTLGDRKLNLNDEITVDGNTGEVLSGAVTLVPPSLSDDFASLMEWADNARRMRVRANADTPEDAEVALRFGADGIGLCRTEHMFFDTHRMDPMREMILAATDEERSASIDRMLPFQRADFTKLFRIMAGLPVMIRLLDPPLHEFLPKSDVEIERVSGNLGIAPERLRERLEDLREANPMLGHRGCRLAISYPDIARMQLRAIFEAASAVQRAEGRPIEPEIMVPLVSLADELDYVKAIVDEVASEVAKETDERIRYKVGTMIELPRAALRASAIAESAEFFSFGTNDLTQTTFGISRDDASPFLGRYREIGIMRDDPFATLDPLGVGELIRMACEAGRRTRPDLALSICGEHGGDPASVALCETMGLDYVSCSPYRVPVARLAAAQATIRAG